mmetsp:Transcript_14752/g.19285  ORF Transcript_14752/g.19285 Transcript_14752/m.19285 type:complete len:310 (+) Transcript_14752:136-1065(+)
MTSAGEYMDATAPPAPEVKKEKKSESALKSFLSGGVGGICVVLVGHPLDLIKVRMQTAAVGAKNASVLGMFANTFAKEGIPGLYRGVSAPLLAVTPIFAISFWGYDMGQRLIRWAKPDVKELSLADKCWAGGFSAIPTTAVMAPSERIKCVMQTTTGKYNGMLDCAAGIYREGGVRSLFRGTFATLLRDVPGSIAWFGMYEYAKLEMMRLQGYEDTSQLSPIAVLTSGGLAGMACWMVAIPPDVLKSRYQAAPEGTYTGIMDVYTKLMKEEGPGALFKGIRPALIRAFPANAACFFGMEVSRKFLGFMD